MQIDIYEISNAIKPHLESLRNFRFSISNPLFWVALFALFLILLKLWDIKKSFSFCCIVAALLLATSKAESLIADLVIKSGGAFDPFLIRVISMVILSFILIYYIFIKGES